MKVVLASQNQGKLREMQAILGGFGFEVVLEQDDMRLYRITAV